MLREAAFAAERGKRTALVGVGWAHSQVTGISSIFADQKKFWIDDFDQYFWTEYRCTIEPNGGATALIVTPTTSEAADLGAGGNMFLAGDIVRISGSTFENNASYAAPDSAPEGGAIYANSAAGLELTDSTFTNNTTDGPGGAIAFDVIGVNSLIDLVTFSNNSAGSVDNPLNYGGSIYLGTIVTGAQLVISRTAIIGSTAPLLT